MAQKSGGGDDNITYVPIRFKEDIDMPEGGEDIYRRQGVMIIEEPEIIEERPLYDDKGITEVAVKPQDVQHAPYEIENPPMPYGEDEDIFGEYMDSEPPSDDKSHKRRRAGGRKERRKVDRARGGGAFGAFLARNKVAIILVAAAVVIAVFYIVTSSIYDERARAIRNDVNNLCLKIENGSGDADASLVDEVAFYGDVFKQADSKETEFNKLNSGFFWIIIKESRADVGLTTLSDMIGGIDPYLKRIDPLLNQIDEIEKVVLGTNTEPGHLLKHMEYNTALEKLDGDLVLIERALSVLEELGDLPNSFTDGLENQKVRLYELSDEVELLKRYLTDLEPIVTEIEAFSKDSKAWYESGSMTGTFGTNLYSQVSVIERGQKLLSDLEVKNMAPMYRSVRLLYDAKALGMDEFGQRMLDESEAVLQAYDVVTRVYDEEMSALAPSRNNGTEKDVYKQAATNNTGYITELTAIELPEVYADSKTSYLDALATRASYISKYLEAVGFRSTYYSNKKLVEDLEVKMNDIMEDIWANHYPRNKINEMLAEYDSLGEQRDDAISDRDAAYASWQSTLTAADEMSKKYSPSVQIMKG